MVRAILYLILRKATNSYKKYFLIVMAVQAKKELKNIKRIHKRIGKNNFSFVI